VLKNWFISLGLALAVAGCATSSGRHEPAESLPADWDSELGPAHEIESATNSQPQNVALAAPTNAPVVRPQPAPQPVAESGMVALSRWAAQNGYDAVRVLPLTPTPAYSVKTPYGTITVRPNSLSAYWGKVEIRLGFKPQLVGSQIYLHALDFKKSIDPLAHGTAVATPPNRLVIIDPGHGGAQVGTRDVVSGRFEKDYTLDWAKRLAPLLEQSGWRVALTRTSDVAMPLADRVAFAEAQRADLFISLHFNAAGDTGQSPAGLETYCLTPAGMPSSLTRGYSDDARVALPNNVYDVQNIRYAMRLHTSLLQVNGNKDRGVRRARFLDVLAGQNRPAVLIEGGYLSNPGEAKLIADPAHRQKLADAIAKALE